MLKLEKRQLRAKKCLALIPIHAHLLETHSLWVESVDFSKEMLSKWLIIYNKCCKESMKKAISSVAISMPSPISNGDWRRKSKMKAYVCFTLSCKTSLRTMGDYVQCLRI